MTHFILQDKITASLSVLSSAQTSHLMSALGLLTIAPLLAPGGGDGTPLSTVPGMMSAPIMCDITHGHQVVTRPLS